MRVFLYLILCLSILPYANAKDLQQPREVSFIAKTYSGNLFDLKEKKGKPIIIVFWAGWCGNCSNILFVLDEIYRGKEFAELEIIGINIEKNPKSKKAIELFSSLSYPNALLRDVQKSSIESPESLPTIYFIGKSGEVIKKIFGREAVLLKREDVEENIRTISNTNYGV